MNIFLLSSSFVPDDIFQTEYEQLDAEFEIFCYRLSQEFFINFADNLKAVFEYAATNPLCITFVCVLLVVVAFHLCPLIFRNFRR